MKLTYWILAISFLASCGGNNTSTTEDAATEAAKALFKENPCEILTEQMVRSAYALDESISITKDDTYGVCTYSWEQAEEAASEEEQLNAVMEAMRTGNMASTKAIASKGHYSAGFNFSTISPKNASDAITSFENIIESLEAGVKVDREKIKEEMVKKGLDASTIDQYVAEEGITFSSGGMQAIAGVADRAMWSPKRKQLTVLSGTHIFFVNVDAGGDDAASLEMAKSLTNTIISTF